jgi:hypothetical protein
LSDHFVDGEAQGFFLGHRVALEWCAGLRILGNGCAADDGRRCVSGKSTASLLHVMVDVRAALLFSDASIILKYALAI